MSDLLILNCPPRVAQPLTEELMDMLEEAHVPAGVLYGVSNKAHDGFVILFSAQRFPSNFIESINQDEEISDYILCREEHTTAEVQPS